MSGLNAGIGFRSEEDEMTGERCFEFSEDDTDVRTLAVWEMGAELSGYKSAEEYCRFHAGRNSYAVIRYPDGTCVRFRKVKGRMTVSPRTLCFIRYSDGTILPG
jgi:hypothetical protein